MKPSRSLRPNHSWLRNFFVVMGANLRAGWGAKQSAERAGVRRAVLPDENVYSRRRGGTPNPLFEWCTFAGLLGGALPIEQIRRSALCQSFHAKQNVPMISQDESDESERWSSAASCLPVIGASRPILLVEILLPASRPPFCNSYSSSMLVVATRLRILGRLFGLGTALRVQCKRHRRSAQSPFETKSQRIEHFLRSGGR